MASLPSKLRKLQLLVIAFVIVIFPIPASFLLENLSKIPFLPEFSKPIFFEEYFKFIGTLIAMIIGFWYADTLIVRRIKQRRIHGSKQLSGFITNYKKSIEKILEVAESHDFNLIAQISKEYEISLKNTIEFLENLQFRHQISPYRSEFLRYLKLHGEKVISRIPSSPINTKILNDINGKIKILEEDLSYDIDWK